MTSLVYDLRCIVHEDSTRTIFIEKSFIEKCLNNAKNNSKAVC